MAAGDITFYEQFYVDVQTAVHDLENDVIKLGLVTNSYSPNQADSDPRWGAGGGTNVSSNEVSPGGNYSAGGPTLANNSVTLSFGQGDFDADDITIAQDPGNPSNAAWGIIYNDTAAGKQAIGFLDLGSVIDLSTGEFSVTWNASGISTLGAAP